MEPITSGDFGANPRHGLVRGGDGQLDQIWVEFGVER